MSVNFAAASATMGGRSEDGERQLGDGARMENASLVTKAVLRRYPSSKMRCLPSICCDLSRRIRCIDLSAILDDKLRRETVENQCYDEPERNESHGEPGAD